MSGGNAPTLSVRAEGLRVSIVASLWHSTIMDSLVTQAVRTCEEAGAVVDLVRVPGAFELPLACQRVARLNHAEAIVALGVVIRGGTPHFDYVCQGVTEGLMRVGLDESIPIGFGLLTVDNESQAYDRAGLESSTENKGREAAEAALAMATVNRTPGGTVGFR